MTFGAFNLPEPGTTEAGESRQRTAGGRMGGGRWVRCAGKGVRPAPPPPAHAPFVPPAPRPVERTGNLIGKYCCHSSTQVHNRGARPVLHAVSPPLEGRLRSLARPGSHRKQSGHGPLKIQIFLASRNKNHTTCAPPPRQEAQGLKSGPIVTLASNGCNRLLRAARFARLSVRSLSKA